MEEEDFLTPEEYNAALRDQLRGGAGGGGSTTKADPAATPIPDPQQPQEGSAIGSFWNRIKGAWDSAESMNPAMRGAREYGRSALRGVAKAFDEGEKTVRDVTGLNIDRIDTEAIDKLLGQRSDDPIAAFTESVTQFATGFMGTGRLKIGGVALNTMRGVEGVSAAAARGAVADFSVFDPYEASLSEMMAKAPVRGISDLGKILEVDPENDGPIVARLKRVHEGILAGAVLDGLVATARIVRSGRTLKSPTATPEAKEVAAQVIEREEAVLEAVGAGTHTPEGDALVVRPNEDGTFRIEETAPPEPFQAYRGLSFDDVMGLDADELRQSLDFEMARESGGEVEVFGEEGAKRYKAAQRTSNSYLADRAARDEADRIIAEMEGSLTPQQESRLFGIGETGYTAEELRDIVREVEFYAPENILDAPDELLRNTLGRELLTGKPTEDVISALRLRGALDELRRRGFEEQDILSAVVERAGREGITAEDASDLLRNTLDKIRGTVAAAGEAAAEEVVPITRSLSSGSPTFTSRAEAETVTAVMNQGIRAREQAAVPTVSTEQVDEVIQSMRDLRGKSRDEILTEMEEVNHFNPSYMDAPEKTLETIQALSIRFKEVIDEAQHHPEGVSVEETVRLAREGLGSLTEYEAPKVISEVLGETMGKSVWTLMGDATLKSIATKVGRMSDALDARPHDAVLYEEARLAIESMLELQVRLAGNNSEIGRTLRMLQERNHEGLKNIEFATEGKPKPKAAKAGKAAGEPKPTDGTPSKPKQGEPPKYTAGMEHHQLAALARMIKMGGGQPANMLAVARGMRVLKHTGKGSKALEVFTNFLLSGPQTPLTALASGTAVSVFEPMTRMIAGFTNGNPALSREGWDILAGHRAYLSDNIASAAAALRAGHSIVNPQPSHAAIGGLTGEVIRMPGRVLMGIDEFIRVSNYRAYVRARSMRIGREQGLFGEALERRVAEDLSTAFDPDTGIAVLKEAADYADTPTFQTQLDPKGFGEGLRRFTNEQIAAKFVAPFVRASVNLFDYAWTMTPGINKANRTYKRVMAEGMAEGATRSQQEAAQALQARAMLGGTIYGFAFYQALAGNLTGEGPVDPELRSMWLKDNQPYSIKIGNKWISYRRMDPIGTPLGLVADMVRGGQETEWGDTSIEELGIAIVSSLVSNLANKTYMQGITDFAAAWGRGDPNATGRWLRNFAASMTVPNLLNQTNPDDLYREADTFKEAIFARIPGLSKTLTPRYNAFGEPIMKAPGYWNRSINIARAKDASFSPVEQALMELEQGFPPVPRTTGEGIDLTDKSWDVSGAKAPYVRWMELISKPEGGPSLREDLEALVTSPEWQQMSAGSEMWKGGERWMRAQGVRQQHQQRAWREVLNDPAYESLATEIQMIRRMEGASVRGGDEGVSEVQRLFEAVR